MTLSAVADVNPDHVLHLRIAMLPNGQEFGHKIFEFNDDKF